MKELHPTTAPLVDSILDDITALINSFVEAGDITNAAAIYSEWKEWLTEDICEINCLPILSETMD